MVMRLFAPQFLVLWAFIASAVAVHFRGEVRFGFWRQVTDHSTIMAPYNVLMYMFSAVPNRPVLRQDMVPELATLRDNGRRSAKRRWRCSRKARSRPRTNITTGASIRSSVPAGSGFT